MPTSERRAEERKSTEGPLKFSFDDPAHQEVTGRLVDYSKSGFRAVHTYPALHAGQVVQFEHVIAVGKAQVMWNRIADNSVETGFLILK
jgi:hypothetical protein